MSKSPESRAAPRSGVEQCAFGPDQSVFAGGVGESTVRSIVTRAAGLRCGIDTMSRLGTLGIGALGIWLPRRASSCATVLFATVLLGGGEVGSVAADGDGDGDGERGCNSMQHAGA